MNKMTWYSTEIGGHTTRSRLYKNGCETPYFVDKADVRAHFTNGHPVGLFGSGMGEPVRCRDGSSYRIAACLGSFNTIGTAKAAAIAKAVSEPSA